MRCNRLMSFYEYINGPRATCGLSGGHKGPCRYIPAMTPFDSESLIETVERVESLLESLAGLSEAGKLLEKQEAERQKYIAASDKFWAKCEARKAPISDERFAEMHKAHLESDTGVNDREY